MSDRGRVLITGIHGFTGRYLRHELSRAGWEVFGTGTHPCADDPGYRRADLGDQEALDRLVAEIRPRAVVHLAAVAFVGHGDANDFYRVNLIGARNLLAALARAAEPPECVVLAGSANVYGNTREGVIDEDTPPNPANDYAVSKHAMEEMARLWMPTLPIVITRPFNYTGAGQSTSFLLPKIVQHFRERAPVIRLGTLDVWRDFSDVRAVVRAYRGLLEACPRSCTFNICSGREHSLREVLAMAESLSGHRIAVEVDPALVRANEVRRLRGDPGRLRALVPDWDMPPLEQTLKWMLDTPRDAWSRL